jgi:hypothetical protein
MSERSLEQTAFVCDLTVWDTRQKEQYQEVLQQMRQSVQEVKEVANGYAFRHPAEVSVLLLLAEFISLEGRCCPFLEFTLNVETEQGPAWLTLTGPEGVKEFLRAELGFDEKEA